MLKKRLNVVSDCVGAVTQWFWVELCNSWAAFKGNFCDLSLWLVGSLLSNRLEVCCGWVVFTEISQIWPWIIFSSKMALRNSEPVQMPIHCSDCSLAKHERSLQPHLNFGMRAISYSAHAICFLNSLSLSFPECWYRGLMPCIVWRVARASVAASQWHSAEFI